MLVGDFDIEELEPCHSHFLFEMNATNIIQEPTCLVVSYIDLINTNSFSNFQNTKAITTGFLDFHKKIVNVLKHTHRSAPKELVYRDYKNFDRVIFGR